jgi:hypothetical protein
MYVNGFMVSYRSLGEPFSMYIISLLYSLQLFMLQFSNKRLFAIDFYFQPTGYSALSLAASTSTNLKQVGNPTSTTSHLKRRETKDAQGSAHFFIYKWVLKLSFN